MRLILVQVVCGDSHLKHVVINCLHGGDRREEELFLFNMLDI